MKRHFIAVAALMTLVLGAAGHAQQKPAPPPGATPQSTTLRVQVVLSRTQADKKISSLPYTLTLHLEEQNRFSGRTNLRLGTQVPITTLSRPGGEANAPQVPTVSYRDVGTSIDCTATAREDGRYKIELTVEESAIETGPGTSSGANPAFKSFRAVDSILLRDGQSAQLSTATDKVNGDVWRVEVTLTVVK